MSAAPAQRRLVLAGGGHAHLQLLADWIGNGPPAVETVLISSRPTTRYSGMIPGWIAGAYTLGEATIDLAALAERAGVRFIVDDVVALSLEAQAIELARGTLVAFDWLSIATGSGVPAAWHVASDRVMAVQPIDRFVDAWSRRRSTPPAPSSVAIVGGGAAGVELAFAIRTALPVATVQLAAGAAGLLPTLSDAVRRRVERALTRRKIDVVAVDAEITGTRVTLPGHAGFSPDLTIVAIGGGSPRWLEGSGLPLDKAGFVQIDATQRALGHRNIFAAGDAAHRSDRPVAHAGVHAVHAGPVVAANLRKQIIGDAELGSYLPRRRTLFLLSTGDRRAILTWGALALEGRWVWWLKDRIDRGWIRKFRRLSRNM